MLSGRRFQHSGQICNRLPPNGRVTSDSGGNDSMRRQDGVTTSRHHHDTTASYFRRSTPRTKGSISAHKKVGVLLPDMHGTLSALFFDTTYFDPHPESANCFQLVGSHSWTLSYSLKQPGTHNKGPTRHAICERVQI